MDVKGISMLGDSKNQVALHYAARSHVQETLESCLLFYSNVDIYDLENKTPLHHAAENGSLTAFKMLVQKQANVQAQDAQDSTVLHLAARSKHIEVVQWILDNLSIDVNTKDDAGKTALDYADEHQLKDIHHLLLEKGAKKSNPRCSI